jgi:hypothetical protein
MNNKKTTLLSKKKTVSLPKAELIQGKIDYPEMIKNDFKKAMLILGLSLLTSLVFIAGLFALFYYF